MTLNKFNKKKCLKLQQQFSRSLFFKATLFVPKTYQPNSYLHTLVNFSKPVGTLYFCSILCTLYKLRLFHNSFHRTYFYIPFQTKRQGELLEENPSNSTKKAPFNLPLQRPILQRINTVGRVWYGIKVSLTEEETKAPRQAFI